MAPDDQYTVKEYLAAMELRLTAHLDRLDHKLEHKADLDALRDVSDRIRILEKDAITDESVRDVVGKAMQDSKARGWTQRERQMGVLLFLVATATFALNLWTARG